MRTAGAFLGLALVVPLLSPITEAGEAPAASIEIVASKRAFSPETLTLLQGKPVALVIRNDDEDLHAFVPLLLLQHTNVQVSGNGAPECNETGFVRVLIPPTVRAGWRFPLSFAAVSATTGA